MGRNNLLHDRGTILMKKIRVLLEGANMKNRVGFNWQFITIIRWAVTDLILVLVKDNHVFQIFTLFSLSIFFQCLLITYRPIDDSRENKITLIIEICVTVYLYILLTLTDWPDENKKMKEKLSWALTILILSIVAVNIVLFFYDLVQKCKRHLNKCQKSKSAS